MTQQRRGPIPATHTGICPVCRKRRKVSPATGRIVGHGFGTPCDGRLYQPVSGSVHPITTLGGRRTCAASWHAPGSGLDYPCNILDGVSTDGRIHKYPDIHRHTGNGLTIEWVDDSIHPTQASQEAKPQGGSQ